MGVARDSASAARMAIPSFAWRVAEVVGMRQEATAVRTLLLDVPGWPEHLAGQHVDVRLTAEDGYQAERSYSIASAPGNPRLELTVEGLPDGEVSSYLTGDLRAGDRFELRGPIGGYFTWQPADGGPLLLVAGGSGIVPLMAMLRARAAADDDVPATLLASWQSFEHVIYREELDRLAASPGVRVVQTLTRSHPAAWSGPTRRIDAAMLEDAVGVPDRGLRAYVCGPTRLVEQVAADLLTLGLPAHRVKTERFGPTGT